MQEPSIVSAIRLFLALCMTYFMMNFISMRVKDIKIFMKNHKDLNITGSFYVKRIITSLAVTMIMVFVLIALIITIIWIRA